MITTRCAFDRIIVLAIVLATVSGCALDIEKLGTVQQASGCPAELCGMNAGNGQSTSCNTVGLPNHYGITMESATLPNGMPVQIGTEDSDLKATILGSGARITGSDLIGLKLVLRTSDGIDIILTIADRTQNGVMSWAFEGEYYPTYDIIWRYATDPEHVSNPMCGAAPWSDQDLTSPTSRDIVILPREAYDWEGNPTNDLANDEQNGETWLTFACAGGALAKKKLMGYDLDFTGARATTRDESHATVSMLNARYCGEASHTQTGTRLWWQNDRQWFDEATADELPIEAIWGADGKALCLNTPRLGTRSDAVAECGPDGLPSCGGFVPQSYTWISHLPLN